MKKYQKYSWSDNERERESMKLHSKTTSLWSYLNRSDVLKSLLNPIYEPNQSVIWPSVAPICIVLWAELYTRWVIDQSGSRTVMNQVQTLVTQEKELRTKVVRLRKQLSDLTKEFQVNNIGVDS